ncbi:MAG: acyl carrier protein [Deltaproteobacteria bacterium]|uniref:Acyl carrier protein n=1 Tax=Candidatus Zymogenus saltonus TaxID=2844893 RepID=A0A9D8KFU1_9DELT|nr:acyl carrier protein [Candidatus Zymogenus saltonus]
MEDKDKLKLKLKTLIIESLQLEDIEPSDIEDDDPLFGNGLGLDSIDALELVVALEKEFGIIIPDEEVGKEAFASLNALADFVERERKDLS